MLSRKNAVVAVIDVQEKLAAAMHERDAAVAATARLIRGARAMAVPVIYTEQNPAGIGPTVPELKELLAGEPVEKMAFSCCREPAFMDAIERLGRRQVLLAGMECHVCIYQTALGLAAAGFTVEVVADAVTSRCAAARQVALAKMQQAGIAVTCMETALFELLETADDPAFRKVLEIVK